MKKPIIAVDIDDVLMPHFQDLINWYNREYGTNLMLADNHPKSIDNWGTDSFQAAIKRVHRFFDTDEFLNSRPFKEAKAAIKDLSDDYLMFVITSRDTLIEETTRKWLNEHFPEIFKEAHFTGLYRLKGRPIPKSEIAKQIKADYLIDDSLEHVTGASEIGIKGLLFGDYPWNQADKLPSAVVRVKDWQEVLEYFDGRS